MSRKFIREMRSKTGGLFNDLTDKIEQKRSSSVIEKHHQGMRRAATQASEISLETKTIIVTPDYVEGWVRKLVNDVKIFQNGIFQLRYIRINR